MDKKQTITTERKIGKITYLVQALPSEKATDTIHKKIEKLIVKDLQKCATVKRKKKTDKKHKPIENG